MASPMLEDDHLYAPLTDLHLEYGCIPGGADAAVFSLWIFPLKGLKPGPLIFLGKDSEPHPLLSLTPKHQLALQGPGTYQGTNQGTAGEPLQSMSPIHTHQWVHVAVEICCGKLRVLINGQSEIEAGVDPNLCRTGPLFVTGSNRRNESLVHMFNPRVEGRLPGAEDENSLLPVQLIFCPRSQNPKTASGTEILEFRPTTLGDGQQVFAVVGGKPSCRRKFVINLELVDAKGKCTPRELDVSASLVFADSGLPVPSGGSSAEAPLLTTFDGVEFPSEEKPTSLVNGRASLKITISQLASKCDNRLFSICFRAHPPGTDRPHLRLLSKPIHSISRKRPHKPRKTQGASEDTKARSKKRAREDGAFSQDVRSDSDDGSSGTTTKTENEHPGRRVKHLPVLSLGPPSLAHHLVPPRGSAAAATPAAPPYLPPVEGRPGADSGRSIMGGLQRTVSWPGVASNGFSGGGNRGKFSPALERDAAALAGIYGLPTRGGPIKGPGSPQDSLSGPVAFGGEDGLGNRPPGSGFTAKVALHAGLLRDCAVLKDEAAAAGTRAEGATARVESDRRVTELGKRQAGEYQQLQALLADRKRERAIDQVTEERHIQGLEQQIEGLQSDLRSSIARLRKKRQQLMDEDAEVHELLVTHLLPTVTIPDVPDQPRRATSADGYRARTLVQNPQTPALRGAAASPHLPAASPQSNPRSSNMQAAPLRQDPPNWNAWGALLPVPDVGYRNRNPSPAPNLDLLLVAGGQGLWRSEPPEPNRVVRTEPFLAQLAVQRLPATSASFPVQPSPSGFRLLEFGGRISDVERHVERMTSPRMAFAAPAAAARPQLLDLMEPPENDAGVTSPEEELAAAARSASARATAGQSASEQRPK